MYIVRFVARSPCIAATITAVARRLLLNIPHHRQILQQRHQALQRLGHGRRCIGGLGGHASPFIKYQHIDQWISIEQWRSKLVVCCITIMISQKNNRSASLHNTNAYKFEKPGWVFYGSPLNPMNLTCVLITVEATAGKQPGK